MCDAAAHVIGPSVQAHGMAKACRVTRRGATVTLPYMFRSTRRRCLYGQWTCLGISHDLYILASMSTCLCPDEPNRPMSLCRNRSHETLRLTVHSLTILPSVPCKPGPVTADVAACKKLCQLLVIFIVISFVVFVVIPRLPLWSFGVSAVFAKKVECANSRHA